MHIDQVTLNLDGSMTITLNEFLNPIVAASFNGATVTGTVTNPNSQQIVATVTLTPGVPIVEQIVQSDPGGSASIDG